jgi:lipoate-protein ligase A
MTGGRGILHGDDLTIAVAAPLSALDFVSGEAVSVLAIYRRTATLFLRAFAKLGVEAALGSGGRFSHGATMGDCFAATSQADILSTRTGRKLLGAALFRRNDAFLQQISVPLRTPERAEKFQRLTARVFRGEAPLWPTMGLNPSQFSDLLTETLAELVPVREADFESPERKRALILAHDRFAPLGAA